jgi:hypothetical protein
MKFKPYTLSMEQSEASLGIHERYGVERALGYLIGEKLIDFVRESGNDPLFKDQLPLFLQEVKRIFTQDEIRAYLDAVENTGAEGHVLSPEDHEFMREAGVFTEDPVRAAQDVLIVEQLKELLA